MFNLLQKFFLHSTRISSGIITYPSYVSGNSGVDSVALRLSTPETKRLKQLWVIVGENSHRFASVPWTLNKHRRRTFTVIPRTTKLSLFLTNKVPPLSPYRDLDRLGE